MHTKTRATLFPLLCLAVLFSLALDALPLAAAPGDPEYQQIIANAPGDWYGIVFLPGSNGFMDSPLIRNGIVGVTIGGPTTGDVGTAVCFTATVAPANASAPIDYLWDPVPDNQGHPTVCYTWMSAGTYVFTVTASNCGGTGSATDGHDITIVAGTVYRVFLPIVGKND